MLRALLSLLSDEGAAGAAADAVCAISIAPRQQPGHHHPSRLFRPRGDAQKVASGVDSGRKGDGPDLELCQLPPIAAQLVWWSLAEGDRRALRLVQPTAAACCWSRCVGSLTVNTTTANSGKQEGGFTPADMRKLGSTFPDLNRLVLQLGGGTESSAALMLQELRGVRLPHLHTFSCDVRLAGDNLLAVARFLVRTPSLKVLRLPNQRGCSPADQRVLCAVLEALPHLTELDLGGAGSSRSGSNAISPSLMRRITKLLPALQQLSCNATAVPDEQLQSLAQLPLLQSLSVSAAGSGRGLSAALRRLTQIKNLEVQHPALGSELVGCLQHMTGLEVLTLGLCPKLSDGIVDEVCGLSQLVTLSLPFPISSDHLRHLSKLPQLLELLSFSSIELDVLGPAHEPLGCVTKLVASSIASHGKPLAALFPALQSVYLRSCGDMEALSLRSCAGSLGVVVAGDCGALTDEGFAGFRSLRGLSRLQVDNAHQLTDLSFMAVFGGPMPALQHITLSGCTGITDTALQLLTASCRRLSTISISNCPQLTDKTLKRLSHCEHLATVSLKACRTVTSEGVAALAAAPQVRSVSCVSCPAVRRSEVCVSCRHAAKVRVVSDSDHSGRRRTSESGCRVSDSGGRSH